MHLSPPSHCSGLGSCPFYASGCVVVVDPLLIVAPIVCGVFVFGPCLLLNTLCPSSVAITFMGKRESVALL